MTAVLLKAAEYEQRFKARIVERLTALGSDWAQSQAIDAANAEWEAVEYPDIAIGFEDDPEGSADEALSYWSAE